MFYLINDYAIFTPYCGYIEGIYLGTFLKCAVKEGIKFLSQSLKSDSMLFGH